MDFILRWLILKVEGLFGDVYKFIGAISQDVFSHEVIQSLFTFFSSIGLSIAALAMISMLFKSLIAHADGKQFSIIDIIKRFIGGGIVCSYGVKIMLNLYYVVLSTTGSLISAIAGVSGENITIRFTGTQFKNVSKMMILILMIVAVYHMMKTFFQLLERAWQYLVTLFLMYLYNAGFIMGNDEALIQWFKQCLAIILTQFFQVLLVTLGISLFATDGAFSTFCISIGAITVSSKIQEILDKYGMSVGGTLGNTARNAMSMAFYARSILH